MLEASLQKREIDKVDWGLSWKLQSVSSMQWETLRRDLADAYRSVIESMKSLDVWVGDDDIDVALAILAHSAYHLGSIRQALGSMT